MTQKAAAARPTRATWVRENLEAIVIAIVLALLIKQFTMEAFVIPTGSMAPTLLGAHIDVECPNCKFPQSISAKVLRRAGQSGAPNAVGVCSHCGRKYGAHLPEDALALRDTLKVRCKRCGNTVTLQPVKGREIAGGVTITCQNCRFAFRVRKDGRGWPAGDVSRGDRILVNKFVYRFREPKRDEVIVFKYPRNPDENFIKRLVGLPGEEIDIRGGDLYIDGKIARKPREVQDHIWIPVYDGRYPDRRPDRPGGPPWKGRSGLWAPSKDQRAFKGTAKPKERAWLEFEDPITNWEGYNVTSVTQDGSRVVPDVRLRFRAKIDGKRARLLVALAHGEDVVEATIGSEGIVVKRRDAVLARSKTPVDLSAARNVALWRADEQIGIDIDGEPALTRFLPAPAAGELAAAVGARSTARVGVEGGVARVKDLRIDRDLYYLRELPGGMGVGLPYRLKADEFFAMGDNSSNSTDSRRWGVVPRGHLLGRAFMVFWPALPGDFEVRRFH